MILAIVFTFILIELVLVGWIDFKTQKISNRWIIINLVASVVLYATFKENYPLSWEVLIFPLGFIFVGFFLYLVNVMGAGDSKYLASLFLVVPLDLHLVLFEKIVLTTISTGAFLLIYRIFLNRNDFKAFLVSHHWEGIKQILKSRFSYAPVILLSWVFLGLHIWN